MSLSSLPPVSVVMPVRNEAEYIERSLGSVLSQQYPVSRMEIIIADGLSQDGTKEKIIEISRSYPEHNIQIIENPGRIVPTGINAAIELAKGEVIIRVDGHCVIPPDYVKNCVEHLRNSDIGGVGGRVITIGETDRAKLIAIGMSSVFGVGGSAFRTVKDERSVFADSVPFPAYTRKSIELAGPYATEFVRNQDDEYNYRLRKKGVKILLAGDIYSWYYSRSSFASLWRQYFYYGFWKVRVLQKHPRQMSFRQFIPPIFVLSLILSAALLFFQPLRIFALLVPLLYLMANLGASIMIAFTQDSRNEILSRSKIVGMLPLVFAILHVSYGLGFLTGMVRFIHRWGR